MKNLKSKTLIERDSKIKVSFNPDGKVCIQLEGNTGYFDENALVILNVFRTPVTIKAALAGLRISGRASWINMTQTIQQLLNAGILRDVNEPSLVRAGTGFGSSRVHIAMLNDDVRTNLYIQAIKQTIQPGDTVIDLGTGAGLLAMAAAKAGAKHVYAIEANGAIAKIAQLNFERNHLADRITLCREWSTEVSLPEKADVLVSETMGNNLFNERITWFINDAKKRLLNPKAKIIPEELELWGIPVTLPNSYVEKMIVTNSLVSCWKKQYGFDFSGLSELKLPRENRFVLRESSDCQNLERISEPVCLAKVELKNNYGESMQSKINCIAEDAGLVNGVLNYFRAKLSSGIWLSTHPDEVSKTNHWGNPIWAIKNGFLVKPNDLLAISYNYNGPENSSDIQVKMLKQSNS